MIFHFYHKSSKLAEIGHLRFLEMTSFHLNLPVCIVGRQNSAETFYLRWPPVVDQSPSSVHGCRRCFGLAAWCRSLYIWLSNESQ